MQAQVGSTATSVCVRESSMTSAKSGQLLVTSVATIIQSMTIFSCVNMLVYRPTQRDDGLTTQPELITVSWLRVHIFILKKMIKSTHFRCSLGKVTLLASAKSASRTLVVS